MCWANRLVKTTIDKCYQLPTKVIPNVLMPGEMLWLPLAKKRVWARYPIFANTKKRSMLWKQPYSLEALNAFNDNTMAQALGIQFTDIGDDFIVATMPANAQTVQPFRILHGGASVALAETLGSVASTLCLADLSEQTAVGLEINANHLKSVKEGTVVTGTCKPIRVGRQVHVWQIEIRDETGDLSCVSRLTVSIVARR